MYVCAYVYVVVLCTSFQSMYIPETNLTTSEFKTMYKASVIGSTVGYEDRFFKN
jgi:hypothetical protein